MEEIFRNNLHPFLTAREKGRFQSTSQAHRHLYEHTMIDDMQEMLMRLNIENHILEQNQRIAERNERRRNQRRDEELEELM